MSLRLTVVGDVLLDRDVVGHVGRLMPEAPVPVLQEAEIYTRPGGAGLAALLAARDGHQVTLVAAVAADAAAAELEILLAAEGIEVVGLTCDGPTAEKVRMLGADRPLLRWDRGRPTGAADVGTWTDQAQAALDRADAVLVSCYGRGVGAHPEVRAAVAAAAASRPVVWDPHPRGLQPTEGVTVATPNLAEAIALTPEVHGGDGLEMITRRAEALARRWRAGGCVVTLGARGALYSSGGGLPLAVPAPLVPAGDACGAGDRFATALAAALGAGSVPSEAVPAAVASASAFVAAGGAGSVTLASGLDPHAVPPEPPAAEEPDALALVERVRARGGTVVATGGCFDLLHTGHVQLLKGARALGDCLVVCLNSDESVQRLKGPTRPLVNQHDRRDVLLALGCVDAVAVFDDDTPVPLLERLRPDVFVKGGDYGATRIPEADALASWGGQVVILPYLEGRSTTRLLEEARRRDQ